MNTRKPNDVFGMLLVFTIEQGVKKMLEDQNIYSETLTAKELLMLYVQAYIRVVLGPMYRRPVEEIQRIFDQDMAFINSMITRL